MRQPAVNLHVVEPAQAGLNSLQSGGEFLSPARGLATFIHIREELAGITNLLDGDTQFVAAARVERFKLLRPLDDLAGAARQLRGREIGYENVATRRDERIARREPITPGKPERAFEHQPPVAVTFDGGLGPREGGTAALFEIVLERCHLACFRLLPSQALYAFFQQHIKVPRRAELFGEPFQLALDVLRIRLLDKLPEQ